MAKSSPLFHAPLQPADTAIQTVGCRHTNPDICGKNEMPDVCAFVRVDGMCLAPPRSWPEQYRKLATIEHSKKSKTRES